LLGADAVQRACEEANDDFRQELSLTLRQWDMFMHGTQAELFRLEDEIWQRSEAQPPKTWQDSQDEHRRQVEEMEQWAKQHKAERERDATNLA
jgi:DNA-binding transcriptional regulator GbsR (MarR family)